MRSCMTTPAGRGAIAGSLRPQPLRQLQSRRQRGPDDGDLRLPPCTRTGPAAIYYSTTTMTTPEIPGASREEAATRVPPQQSTAEATTTTASNHNSTTATAAGTTHRHSTHPEFEIDSAARTISTAVGSLPLSPIMDPAFWAAKQRHKTPKADAGRPRNALERAFRSNPYALALATPMRQCSMTKARLPSFFLQDFSLIAHPTTGEPWWVPRSLVVQRTCGAVDGDASSSGETAAAATAVEGFLADPHAAVEKKLSFQEDTEEGSAATGNVFTNSQPDVDRPDTSAALSTDDRVPNGPRAYMLARRDLVSALAQRQSGFHERRLMSATSSKYRDIAVNGFWRTDMDTVALDLMRRGILDDLLYLARLCAEGQRYYIVRCYGWGDVQYKHKGAILWFDKVAAEIGSASQDTKVVDEVEPAPYAVFDVEQAPAQGDQRKESLVIHNIPKLLGKAYAERLREGAKPFSDGGEIFMLAGRRTLDVQEKLWKLHGYLVDYHGQPSWD
ncbi:hypothetical protein Micbo1qcDRAFT_160684 [Microdochium bolleyi]|uniref:Uncharacterized protein n=1 Tax=Microdochium bolleyi TaxID=196109 RepID=A0A136J6T5_9PEZI|nr:hypothetical protein Micbo1qcDRAFT_160684 [Microdochium bolleyi]